MADNTHKINLIIITPKKTFYEGMVSSASLPTIDGESSAIPLNGLRRSR